MKPVKIVIFIIIQLQVAFSFSQLDTRAYPFIKREYNKLYFSNDSSSFINFFKKLDSLREGELKKVSLLHMGGSHVQGGIWTNVFLNDFQQQFQTSGGGFFVFPYKIAKTNSQPYSHSFTTGKWKRCRSIAKEQCLPIGMSGISVVTNDSANIFGVTLTKQAICRSANVIKVYHNFNQSFDFSLSQKFNGAYSREDKYDLGYSQFSLLLPSDSISFDLERKDTLNKDFILFGFSLENDLNLGFYMAGLGANGASSSSFLKCSQLIPQLQSIQPHLAILSLGVNDTQSKGFEKEDYIEHYDSLIIALKKANPTIAIVLTTTTDNFVKRKNSNKRTIGAQEAMFELMRKHNVAVWDLFAVMGGFKSIAKWNKAGLAANDRVHFNAKGYTILGHLMHEAINQSYSTYKNLKN